MAVGFCLNKFRIIPGSATPHLVTLLVWITTPCMIFASITTREYHENLLGATLQMFALGILFFAVALVVGLFLCKKVFKVPEEDLGVYSASFAGINNGFMGFPITQAIFGGDIFYFMVIFNICLNIYMYSACPVILNMGSGKRTLHIKYILKKLANPSTIVCFVSLFMLINGLQLPSILFDSVNLIGDITVPLSMLVVGMQLADSNVARVIKNKKLVVISFLKMLLLPVFIFLLVNWLPVAAGVKTAVVFGSCFPCAVVISALAVLEKKNSLLAAEMVALTTLISVGTIPIAAFLLTNYYGF